MRSKEAKLRKLRIRVKIITCSEFSLITYSTLLHVATASVRVLHNVITATLSRWCPYSYVCSAKRKFFLSLRPSFTERLNYVDDWHFQVSLALVSYYFS